MNARQYTPPGGAPSGRPRDSLERLLERLPVAVERIALDGTIVYSNPAHHEMLGYAPGELIGRSIFDLVDGPEEATRLRDYLTVLLLKQPRPEPWITTNLRNNDEPFVMRVDWRYERDEEGEPSGFVAVMTDITAQRQAEEERDRSLQALETSRRHLASLMENAVDFVLYRLAALPEKPYAAEVVFVSPSIREILGVEDERDFSSWFASIVPEDRQRVIEANRRSVEEGRIFDEVMRIVHPQRNEVRWIRAISRPILDEADKPAFFNGLLVDITTEKRAEEQRRRIEIKLEESQRLESLGTLAGGIAHDFNNLLVGILGSSDLALESLLDDSPARRQVQNVVQAAERAADLTNQLLAYSGRGIFRVENADLNHVVEEMAAILATAVSKKARLELALADSLPAVRCDLSQIRQVIMNLITNASDALENRVGVIRLRTEEIQADVAQGDGSLPPEVEGRHCVRLDVSDNGSGIDPDAHQRIFDPFFSTKTRGHGLGLAAVRGIIESHRGGIQVHSEPGSGTTFSVFLPVAAAETAALVPEVPLAPGRRVEEARLILVIDDEAMVRRAARRILESHGHRVLTANDGSEGVALFSRFADRVDAVLLDLSMPRMDGREAFEELRRLQPDLPVLFSTGYHEKEATDLLADENTDFIQKPYRVAELLEKISGL